MENKIKYSVIMGDIISSRKADSELILYKNFNKIVDEFNLEYKELIISPLTITLGDEFQGLTNSLYGSFILANLMRIAFLQNGIHVRFVIGVTDINSRILNRNNSWNMIGSGFAEARRMLNDKKNKNSYRFNLEGSEVRQLKVDILLNTIGRSMTDIEEGWTEKQLQTISEMKKSEANRSELASKLGKARNTLYKSLKAAKFDLYEEEFDCICSTLEVLDFIKEGL